MVIVQMEIFMNSLGEYCCDKMLKNLNHKCKDHPSIYDCPDALLDRYGDNVGIIIHDGGSSMVRINAHN